MKAITFIKAYDGDEALQMISTYEIELMILDIMMPKRNGLEVCQKFVKIILYLFLC